MKKLLSFVTLASLLLFVACQDDETKSKETPSNIPGMGNAGGELQAESYEFNEDLTFDEIVGIGATELAESLKSTTSDDVVITGSAYGSGDQVVVTLTITNNNTEDCRSAWLRAGTVFASSLTGVQNAILLAPVNVCIPPSATKSFVLHLYCLNLGMDNPDGNDSYEMLGVTTSEPVLKLINALAFKKVNFEHYEAYPEVEGGLTYTGVRSKLQDMIWKITNGGGLVQTDYDFIATIPDLPDGVLPEYIYDLEYTNLPDCWCIDECNVVTNSGALSNVVFFVACSQTPYAEYEGQYYNPDGFPFVVSSGFSDPNYDGEYEDILDFSRAIKFEAPNEEEYGSTPPQLGEDGSIDVGIFEFITSCQDEQIYVRTKNKDEIISLIDVTQVGEAVLMTNGFMVEFLSVVDNGDNSYTYKFRIISDSCGGN